MEGVSVVIPCYNVASYIAPAIESVLAQEYEGPIEIVVGDDGSTDETREIVGGYPQARLQRHPGGVNRGPAATRNICLAVAAQPLVAFLDGDDVWMPGHLRALAGALAAHPQAGLACCEGYDLSPDGAVRSPRLGETLAETFDAPTLLAHLWFPPSGVMVRRSVLDRVGLFDETAWGSEDQDLWLRVLEVSCGAHSEYRGYCYRNRPAQITSRLNVNRRFWLDAERTFKRAIGRYSYPRHAVRERRARLAYYLARCDMHEGKLARAAWLLAKSAMLDSQLVARRIRESLASGRG